MPFAALRDLVTEEWNEGGFGAGCVVEWDGLMGDGFKEFCGGGEVVEEGVGLAEVPGGVVRGGADVVDEGGEEANGLGRGDALCATEVVVSAGRDEPVTKRGGATVHRLVIAVSDDSSVCGSEKVEASTDKSSGGMRHTRKGRSLGQDAITLAQDGDFSKRDRLSASTLETPRMWRGWSCKDVAGKTWDKKCVRRRARRRTGGRFVRDAYRSQESADVLSAQTRMRCPPAGIVLAGAAWSSLVDGLSLKVNSWRTHIHNSMKMAMNSRMLMWIFLGSMSASLKLCVLSHPMLLGNPAACRSCIEMRHMWLRDLRSHQPPSAFVEASVAVVMVVSRGMRRPIGRFHAPSWMSVEMRARNWESSSRMSGGREDLLLRYQRLWCWEGGAV